MKTIFIFLIILLSPAFAWAGDIGIQAGTTIVGHEYNEVLNRYIERKITIWGFSDNTFSINGGTTFGDADVYFPNEKKTLEKLVWVMDKSLEWSDIAIKNNASASKLFGCFLGEEGFKATSCPSDKLLAAVNHSGRIIFSFKSSVIGGKAIPELKANFFSYAIGSLPDREAAILIPYEEIKKLKIAVQNIGEAIKWAKERAKKEKELFK
ncbi:MAG: hypothetical protein HY280_06060 [Nitrospinae bacterium]|nr:hypothetical protein [Nitrospinota bacterium]